MTLTEIRAELRYLRKKSKMLGRACTKALRGKFTHQESLEVEDASEDIRVGPLRNLPSGHRKYLCEEVAGTRVSD